ncbi:MAG: multiheme c-type cytochrome, partial [Gammaproteobacteria bacterium]
MAPCCGLLLVGTMAFVAAVAARHASPAIGLAGHEPIVASGHGGAVGDGYVGSAVCRDCHDGAYASWARSLHVQMTQPLADARVLGDFRPGTRFERYGRTYTMEARDGRHFMSVSHQGLPPEKYEIHYTLGARRFQGYLSRLPDGRIYVLPAFWHAGTAQWIDFTEITPVPDSDHDFRQIWNVNCFNCHATNLVQNFDVRSKRYATTWTEMGISCEACHGPGAAHVRLMEEWEVDPSRRPDYDTRSSNREISEILRILSPRSAEPRRVVDMCGYCHGNKTNFFSGFAAGDRYEDFALPFLISEPIAPEDPQGDFWPDGRPTNFNRPQALMQSGCFAGQRITCTSCHRGHDSPHDPVLKVPVAAVDRDRVLSGALRASDQLCTQCHQTFMVVREGEPFSASFTGPELSLHTYHPPESPGSRCVDCHMSEVNWRLLMRRRDHTFAPPVPELTARYGVPNSCTTCHDERTPEWAAAMMDRSYGDRGRRSRAVRVADTMYAAGSGDPAALPR